MYRLLSERTLGARFWTAAILGSFACTGAIAYAETFTVNFLSVVEVGNDDWADDPDARPGDGIAERVVGSGEVTLRSAIEEANALPGHDIILLPGGMSTKHYTHYPPLTDPAGVTIMSIGEGRFTVDGTSAGDRISGYASLLNSAFAALDVSPTDDRLSISEARGIFSENPDGVADLFENQRFERGLSDEDFSDLDLNGDGFLTAEELQDVNPREGGFVIASPNNKIINVAFANLPGVAIELRGPTASNNIIQGCYIGTNGSSDANNDEHGILITGGAHSNLIGGTTEEARNIISGNGDSDVDANMVAKDYGHGILITGAGTTNNTIIGNYIGTDETGETAVPNAFSGIAIINGAHGNIIGGPGEGERNIISGNGMTSDGCDDNCGYGFYSLYGHGIFIANSANNRIQGNWIGVNSAGERLGNYVTGIRIINSVNDLIGGPTPEEGNVIAGHNVSGIRNWSPGGVRLLVTTATRLQNNVIGLLPDGESFGGNYRGLLADFCLDLEVGAPGAGNVISGNGTRGMTIIDSAGALIQGNFIGTDVTGSTAIPNDDSGLQIIGNFFGVDRNLVGGSGAGEGNVISGNFDDGIILLDASGVDIEGNHIGVSASGTQAVPNSVIGILVNSGSRDIRIGGSGAGQGNVISANEWDGIRIARSVIGSATRDIIVQGNRIGVAATGTAALPNRLNGITLLEGAIDNIIGGVGPGEGNIIAFSGVGFTDDTGQSGFGVRIKGGSQRTTERNTVRGNSIFSNREKGIVLQKEALPGATPVNNDIAPPVINSIGPVIGTGPANSFIDLYGDNADEGRLYLGTGVSDGAGNFSFDLDLSAVAAANLSHITATATDSDGNTSEFSAPMVVAPPSIVTPPSALRVAEGDPFSLTIEAAGSELLVYTWEYVEDGSDFVPVADDGVFSGSNTNQLQNNGARIEDGGIYRCVVTNAVGTVSTTPVIVEVIPLNTDVSTVSTLQDVVDGNTMSPAHLIANPGADGAISLREAIIAANNRAGADTINFGVTGTILLSGGLPNLADGETTINGGGQITLDGNSLAGSIAGLRIVSADNVVRGLAIVRFPGSGVEIDGAAATGNLIADCFIGTNGQAPLGNNNHGVLIQNGASDNLVGGADAGDRNILSGNIRSGVFLTGTGTSGNRILGNYIGLDSAGVAAVANGATGVSLVAGASDNAVGGVEEGEGNVISSNITTGVFVSGAGTSGNLIAANLIGLDANGAGSLGNVRNGVAILDGATDTTVGGDDPLAANTISGNGNAGVLVDGAASLRNTVRLNSIHGNFATGIALTSGANADIAAPEITMLGSVIGTAAPGATVDIYASEDGQGRLYLDTVAADGDGAFFSAIDLAEVVGLNVTATATDADGNTSAFSPAVFVDLAPPVLTLNGSAEVTAQCGSPYTDAGVTAIDDVDGDLSGQVVVTVTRNGVAVSSVDTSVLGVYTLVYEVSDSGGQAAVPVTRTVTVVDTAAPVITLNGSASVTVECNTGFTDPGATAIDACEGSVAVSVAGVVDVTTPGVYPIVYSASDGQGNTATPVTRTVTVRDTAAPVITLNGAASVTIECGTPYLDPGATATDACDTAVEVVVDNPVEPGVAGLYTVLYDAVDASGNRATQAFRVVEVVDTRAPVIQLLGAADLTVECGVPFVDPGVVVTDACDGGLPAIVSGGVNTDVPGNYTVVYSASDSAGNAAESVTRIVRVADNAVPEILLNGPATVNVPCGGVYEELGATAIDGCEGNLTDEIAIGGSVNTGVAGRYTITYDVQDSRGNVAARRTRTVIVATCPAPCEDQCATDPANQVDEDGDGLSACVEACLGTDDTLIDTDGDGVPDNVEVATGTDPTVPDSDLDLDGDGLTQLEEFIFDSDPLDPNSPAVSFFVAPNGANLEAGGDSGAPWATIAYAIEQANPSVANPVRIVLADGNYPEDVELVPGVTLVGAVGSLPRIEGAVFGADNSALINVELAAFTSDDVLLVIDNVAMSVENVVFRGSAARPAAGILAIGARARGSMIDGCLFTSLSIGIDVEGGLPAIRRCTFENTSIAGVFLRSSASIASGVSLGNANDPSTGSNLFSGVTEGRAVINDTNTLLLAQQNDWGAADVNFIEQNLVRGRVEVSPVLAPGTAVNTGSLYVTVWTAATQSRISTATVVVTGSGGASVTIPLARNGVYAVPVLRSGTYTLAVSAPLFEARTQTITLEPGELGSRIVALSASAVKPGGPSCSAASGSLGAFGWMDGLLAALMLALLLWLPVRRSARG
ncbi:MAG: DUF5011 domain-containing protein [Candidatus Hydrogenedentes bacterium]|nr:DUF5011 domain-containing protein [Candidatus Hydrogenedentota bacterium]